MALSGAAHGRVTVGVPVYNGETFLAAALDAILEQDFEDFELIISDNGSTDGTPSICRAALARDERVRYLRSETNYGLAWNWNRLVAEAAGEYFVWAAYDDLRAPSFLSRCVEALEREPGAVLAHPRAVEIDAAGVPVRSFGPLARAQARKAYLRFGDVIMNEVHCFPISGLVRLDVLRRTALIGAYPSSDLVLLAELALHGRFQEVAEELFFRRDHPGRSMRLYPLERDRVAFFDPSKADAVTFPQWRMAAELLRAVRRAPLPPSERARCFAAMAPWLRRCSPLLARNVVRSSALALRRALGAAGARRATAQR